MSIIYILIPIAMLFVLIAVSLFFWAVKSEQFDDLDRQSVSILFDEDDIKANTNVNGSTNSHPTNSTNSTSAELVGSDTLDAKPESKP